MARMRSGFAVIGDTQHLPGYSLYDWEPLDKISGPAWRYPKELRNAPEHAYNESRHGDLRAAITAELARVMEEAYAELRLAEG